MHSDDGLGADVEPIRELAQAPITHGSNTEAKPRITGAAFFGFLVGAYLQNAAEQSVPVIMSIVQKIDLQAARTIYDESSVYRTSVLIIGSLLGATVAGFLARKKAIFAGLLSSLPYILVAVYILLVSLGPQYSAVFARLPFAEDLAGDTSLQHQAILRLVLFGLAGSLGGLVGHRLYAPEIDVDLGQVRVTIFGIRWAHYFWILPFIYLAFLASVLMIVYAAVTILFADFFFAWHPSLWFDSAWNWGFPVGPFLAWLAIWITGVSFIRFYKIMQYRQAEFKGWKKVRRILLYGVGAPALSYTVAALAADVALAMPKPVEGDWKIAVGISAVILGIVAIISLIAKIRERVSRWQEPEAGDRETSN